MTAMSVNIESVDGNQMAAKITGKFEMDGRTFDFTAIAFGRIGGQNIGAKIDEQTISRLRSLGYDPDAVIDTLQTNLVRGNLNLPPGLQRESFADG